MPALIPSYEYDIFISYRHNDNKSGWVTEFVKNLQEELSATIKEPVTVYFDVNPHDGLLETHNVDKSLEGKLKCLIFIPILSQTYCDPKSFAWQHEFVAFNKLACEDTFGRDIKLSNGNVASRILPVKIHDLDTDDLKSLKDEIGGVLRAIEFIYKEPGVNRPLSPNDEAKENFNKTKYRNQVNKVANAIKEIITGLKNFGHSPFYSPSQESLSKEIKSRSGKSIVVLPFEDMSPEKGNEYFSDGLTEEIIANLSRINSLKVLSRTSSMHYKKTQKSLKEIANELAAEYVLEGSVRKQGKDVRITAQLIEASQDVHLWADKYRGTLENVFDIQEKVAEEIVKALKIQLTPDEDEGLRKRYTKNTEAFELYLKGNFTLWQFSNDWLEKAIAYFQDAIRMDPDFGPPYAGIAMCYNGAAWFELIDVREALSKSREWAAKAIEIDDTLAEAYNYLGYNNTCNWNWAEAEQQFKHAIDLKPNYADAHLYYGWMLGAQARIDEAKSEMKRAYDLDPRSTIINANLSFPPYWNRQYDQAIVLSQRAVQLDATHSIPRWFLGIANAQTGNYQEAISAFENAISLSGGGPYYKAWLGHSHALAGNRKEALKILTELEQLLSAKKTLSYQIALVHLGLGNHEKALDYLEQAYVDHGAYMIYFKIEPYLDPLRSNPRFKAILEKMGLGT